MSARDAAAARPIRVAIADDQPLMRSALATMIRAHDDLELAGEAADGIELLAIARARRLDVVLMDIRMPNLDGIDATRTLSGVQPGARVLVLTTFDLDEYVLAAVRAGASGFLLKDISHQELARAIRAVHSGDSVLAPRATESLMRLVAAVPQQADPDILLAALTPREREVFECLLDGEQNDEIAHRLYLTTNTVKTHVKSILGKLGLRDRVHVVIWGFENGLRPG